MWAQALARCGLATIAFHALSGGCGGLAASASRRPQWRTSTSIGRGPRPAAVQIGTRAQHPPPILVTHVFLVTARHRTRKGVLARTRDSRLQREGEESPAQCPQKMESQTSLVLEAHIGTIARQQETAAFSSAIGVREPSRGKDVCKGTSTHR